MEGKGGGLVEGWDGRGQRWMEGKDVGLVEGWDGRSQRWMHGREVWGPSIRMGGARGGWKGRAS